MPHPTGPTNSVAIEMISELRKNKFADIAKQLTRPTRSRKAVTLNRLAKLSRKTTTFVVPGKVVGRAEINKVNVYAFAYSKSAKEAITKSGGKAMTLRDFIKDKPKAYLVK